MAVLTPAVFREGALVDATQGCAIPAAIPDAVITAAIARMTERFEYYADDQFESTAATTIILPGSGLSRLRIPKRTTAVTTLKTVDYAGTETTQAATTYRLHSSLNTAGTKATGLFDFVEILAGTSGFTNMLNPYYFDRGAGTVKLTGTFGWTVTPPDVKRAVALMVWDALQPRRADLHRVTSVSNTSEAISYADTEPTGMLEVDDIIQQFSRHTSAMVG